MNEILHARSKSFQSHVPCRVNNWAHLSKGLYELIHLIERQSYRLGKWRCLLQSKKISVTWRRSSNIIRTCPCKTLVKASDCSGLGYPKWTTKSQHPKPARYGKKLTSSSGIASSISILTARVGKERCIRVDDFCVRSCSWIVRHSSIVGCSNDGFIRRTHIQSLSNLSPKVF